MKNCKTCGHELPEEAKTLVVNGVEYDTETTQKGVIFENIKIPKGKRLWTHQECIKFNNDKKLRNKLKLEDCWFYLEQPFDFNKDEDYVAWFYADSVRAVLSCSRIPQGSCASLGVRFAKDLKK